METVLIRVPYLLADGVKTRLYSEAERRTLAKRIPTEPELATAIQSVLDADAAAHESPDVREWLLTFRVPSYREGLAIMGQARRVAIETGAGIGIEIGNDALTMFVADVRAATCWVSATGDDAPTDWEAVPESWRGDLAGLLDAAVKMSDEDRGFFFPPSETTAQTV